MKKNILLLMAAIALSFTFSSCKKKDNTGRITFWQNQVAAQDNAAAGITLLNIKVNGQIAGTMDASTYFNAAPDCGTNGAVTFELNMGEATSKNVDVIITDQDGDLVYNFNEDVKADQCVTTKLE